MKSTVAAFKESSPSNAQHFRKIFVAASTLYPLGGICAVFYVFVACYFMYSGVPPISTPGLSLVGGWLGRGRESVCV